MNLDIVAAIAAALTVIALISLIIRTERNFTEPDERVHLSEPGDEDLDFTAAIRSIGGGQT